MKFSIALLKGDGIGPEIIDAALAVIRRVGEKFGHTFETQSLPAGGTAIDAYGVPLPEETVAGCLKSDAVLLGAVGGPKWDTLPGHLRPEAGLLGIRKALGLYANLRPVKLFPALRSQCLLKGAPEFDILIVRELTGGIYFGERGRLSGKHGAEAFDTERYSVAEIERIGRTAFESAENRSGRVTSIDKANILETSRLWREVMHRLSKEYPDVAYSDMLVDNAAMQLIRNPGQFDVIVTSNMFGDILSDEASQLTGSIGMLPSASLGGGKRGLYEPIHGSAPDIAGTGTANPIAAILSAAMMFRHSFGLKNEAEAIENAVNASLDAGYFTRDLGGGTGTDEMTEKILSYLI